MHQYASMLGLSFALFHGLILLGDYYINYSLGQLRLIHFLSYAMFALALLHGLLSGTDAGTLWARGLYWVSVASLLFFTIYRVLFALVRRKRTAVPRVRTTSP